MPGQITIKKSPVVIIKNFLVAEVLALAGFYIAAIVADYGDIYSQIGFVRFLSFEVAEISFVVIGESLLILFIFMRWLAEFYVITPGRVTHKWGLIFKNKTVIQVEKPVSITYRRGLFYRFIKYGKVEIHGRELKRSVALPSISNPQTYGDAIMRLNNGGASLKNSGGNRTIRESAEFNEDVMALLSQGENNRLEFKMSLRWDSRKNQVSKQIERSVIKTAAAFLNSEGGQILIGVDDEAKLVGIDNDYKSLGKPNPDGFENHFNNLFLSMIGAEFRRYARLKFQRIEDKEVCLITVLPAPKPAYVRIEESEDFFIRTGNSTTSLKVSETATYIASWWSR